MYGFRGIARVAFGVTGVDVVWPKGKFFVEKESAYDDGSFDYVPRGTGTAGAVVRIVATPLEVGFSDGSVWQAPNPPRAGERLAEIPTGR